MVKALVWSVAMVTATTAAAEQVARRPPAVPPVTVVMTAATLADDCGGAAPIGAPAPVPTPAPAAKPAPITASKSDAPAPNADADADMAPPVHSARMKGVRRCEQTSMQLAVTAYGARGGTTLVVKKVELFDEAGKSLGVLTASKPRVWNTTKSVYETWNQAIRPNQSLNVSYALSQPSWGPPVGRRDKTYTLKATVTVGKATETVSRDVQISAPTILPPNVKT
ncbi:MAG: hypothetical protein SFX73_03025 [Kofleriaceae bacterium]|nr:hypothetical protein [Kofleriaceae bacterium]